jgi:hypothetical protein
MKQCALILFFCCEFFISAQSQTPAVNLEKYWRYRERLKNFVVPGDCFGCSLPAAKRSGTDFIDWSDATIHLGYYIGMLATEHKLLTLYNQSPQRIKETERELFYAIEAINRLDLWAEYRWEEYELGIVHNGQPPPMSHLNGFFIRDDIGFDENYFGQTVNGKTVREHLNSSLFSLPGGYNLLTTESGFTYGVNDGFGPREESQDQVIQLFTGLALVVKLIDPQLTYSDAGVVKTFMDQETSFVQEVKNIANRITSNIQSNGWLLKNPVMPDCVQGVCGSRSCVIGACGGGNATGLCYGIYRANCYIQQQGVWCNSDAQTNGNSIVWATTLKTSPIGSEDFKVLTLAAVGDVWESDTKQIIKDRCSAVKATHLPLLYAILHDNATTMLPPQTYTAMFNSAWCSGNNGYEGPIEWRGQSWLLYGWNEDAVPAPVHFSNIDYMMFLNMYALIYPQYFNGTYQYISPEKLCEETIIENAIQHQEQRNLTAASSIRLSNYHVVSSAYTTTSFHILAGQEITLNPGTTFLPGAEITATINKDLGKYNCVNRTPPIITTSNRLPERMEIIPNPSGGTFNVTIQDPPADGALFIYNASGQIIMKREGITASNAFTVAASGVYLIRLESESLNLTGKVIVAPGN